MQIIPDLEEFKRNKAAKIVFTKLAADLETPVSATLKLKNEPFCCLFESVEEGRNRGRYSFIAIKPDIIWKCASGEAKINREADKNPDGFISDGRDIFDSLRNLIKESSVKIPDSLPPMSAGIFGYMGYDMVRYMEKLPDSNPDVINIPEAVFIRPQIIIVFDSVKDEMIIASAAYDNSEGAYNKACDLIKQTINKLANTGLEKEYLENLKPKQKPSALNAKSNMSRDEYHAMVEKAKEYIVAGDIFQVVPSQRFTVEFQHDAMALYRSLRRLNPSPYSFYMKMEGFALVGSSPEILVRARDGKATVRPIAGTRKRGANEAEDKELAANLLDDNKELAEHLMLIDLGRNDIGRVAKTGTVKVTEQMVIEYYSHVMHIVSNVEGNLRSDVDALDAVIAGFPVGTVSGAPKIRAMEIIDDLEKERRSFYAGGVGYFSADGSVDMCIALRTGLVKDGKLYVQAGGGVVADSDPEAEYQESCNKARALLAAAENVG